jgi:hypothetical protein
MTIDGMMIETETAEVAGMVGTMSATDTRRTGETTGETIEEIGSLAMKLSVFMSTNCPCLADLS